MRFGRTMAVMGALALVSTVTASAATGVVEVAIPKTMTAALYPKYGSNCVLFLRNDVGIKLPNVDLTTWKSKKAIVNVKGSPRYGDVAIIELTSGQYVDNGHVAMVRDVTNTSIQILEANWFYTTKGDMRLSTAKTFKDAEKQLKIFGYYRP